MNTVKLLKSNFFLNIINLLGVVISFSTQLIIAKVLGTNTERDAYFVAMTIPGYLSGIFIGAFGSVFLPKFIIKQKEGATAKGRFIATTFNIIFIFLSLICLLGIIYSKEIVGITAIGFKPREVEFTSSLLQILFPTLLFQGLSNLIASISQSDNRFVLPAISPVVSSIVSLVFVFIFISEWGIKSLAIGTLIGNFLALILLLPIIRKDYRFQIDFTDREFLSAVLLSIPLFLSGFLTRSTSLFERIVASTLPEGSISYLGYATQVQNILSTIAIGGIGSIIFPMLSKKWTENNLHATKIVYENGIRIVLMITIPIAMLFIFEGELIVQLIFERGKFSHHSSIIVSNIFSILSLSFIGGCLGSVVRKLFYFSGKTLFVSITDMVISLLYFIIGVIFVKYFSFYGLAMAASITACLSFCVTISLANRILKGLDFYLIVKDPVIVLVVSTFSAFFSKYIVLTFLDISNLYALAFTQIAFYGIVLYILLGLTEIKELTILNVSLLNFLWRK